MHDEEILEKARQTYGNKNQILVSMEELNELACVLAKYPRYDDENKATHELFDKVLDEVADVHIVLNHIKAIFHISEDALNYRMSQKISRLERWLNNSTSMQETIDDRTIENKTENTLCTGCMYIEDISEYTYINRCRLCYQAQVTEGVTPYKRIKE